MGFISEDNVIHSVEEGKIYKSNQLRFFAQDYKCMLVEEGIAYGLQGGFFWEDDLDYKVVKIIQDAYTYLDSTGRRVEKIIIIKRI